MKTFPFTKSHIKHFKYEMKKAGGFFELMYEKEAIVLKNGLRIVAIKSDIEEYGRKHISGHYHSLKAFYDNEIPILFWIELYQTLKSNK